MISFSLFVLGEMEFQLLHGVYVVLDCLSFLGLLLHLSREGYLMLSSKSAVVVFFFFTALSIVKLLEVLVFLCKHHIYLLLDQLGFVIVLVGGVLFYDAFQLCYLFCQFIYQNL